MKVVDPEGADDGSFVSWPVVLRSQHPLPLRLTLAARTYSALGVDRNAPTCWASTGALPLIGPSPPARRPSPIEFPRSQNVVASPPPVRLRHGPPTFVASTLLPPAQGCLSALSCSRRQDGSPGCADLPLPHSSEPGGSRLPSVDAGGLLFVASTWVVLPLTACPSSSRAVSTRVVFPRSCTRRGRDPRSPLPHSWGCVRWRRRLGSLHARGLPPSCAASSCSLLQLAVRRPSTRVVPPVRRRSSFPYRTRGVDARPAARRARRGALRLTSVDRNGPPQPSRSPLLRGVVASSSHGCQASRVYAGGPRSQQRRPSIRVKSSPPARSPAYISLRSAGVNPGGLLLVDLLVLRS